mmetsp:Transcript_87747/g.146418  ORF Transcript_87747/g.146418 Transcript_87747/m.146418 type:complete len:297 (-) Transcript_87747:639-1529(-)
MWRHIEGVFHRRMLVMGKGGTWKLTGQCLWHAHPYTNYHNTFIFWTNAELPLVWGRMPFMGYRAAPLPTTNSICNRQLTVPSRFFFLTNLLQTAFKPAPGPSPFHARPTHISPTGRCGTAARHHILHACPQRPQSADCWALHFFRSWTSCKRLRNSAVICWFCAAHVPWNACSSFVCASNATFKWALCFSSASNCTKDVLKACLSTLSGSPLSSSFFLPRGGTWAYSRSIFSNCISIRLNRYSFRLAIPSVTSSNCSSRDSMPWALEGSGSAGLVTGRDCDCDIHLKVARNTAATI